MNLLNIGNRTLLRKQLRQWLLETEPSRLKTLWREADRVRHDTVGDGVHLRGIIEISNYCRCRCRYCGINAENFELPRYRMQREEILKTIDCIARSGYGTVVLQSGEDPGISTSWLTDIIATIKRRHDMAVTLSLGERTPEELSLWRDAGADRYLLKIESSDQDLFEHIHPSRYTNWLNRLQMLRCLRTLGYEIGSGIMIGIPGQHYDILVNDLLTLYDLQPDMIGNGPFIPHPKTALHQELERGKDHRNQVPNDTLMTYKVNALMRLLCPETNIPTTSALVTLDRENGRELGLVRGANVIMPNFTPIAYRASYDIYPRRVCLQETAEDIQRSIDACLSQGGRFRARGPGSSLHYQARRKTLLG